MKNENPVPGCAPQSPRSVPPRRRSAIALCAALAVVVLLLCWISISDERKATSSAIKKHSLAVAPVAVKRCIPRVKSLQESGDKTQAYTEFATSVMDSEYVFDVNRASGAGRFLVGTKWDREFVPDSDALIGRELWIADATGNGRLVHGSVTRACFSPDGTKIAYITTENVLHAETVGGDSLGSVDRAYDPSWSRDGKQIVFSKVPEGSEVFPARELRLAVWDYAADKVEVLTSGHLDDIHGHFGPTGEWILFVSAGRSGWASFYVMPRTGGEPRALTNREMDIPVPYNRMMWSKDGRWFIYDVKDGETEETWALEINADGSLQQAAKLARALDPQVLEDGTIVSIKRNGDSIEPIICQLPGSSPKTAMAN